MTFSTFLGFFVLCKELMSREDHRNVAIVILRLDRSLHLRVCQWILIVWENGVTFSLEKKERNDDLQISI
jgi:hypothetical protein